MAKVYVKLRVLPESVDIDMAKLGTTCTSAIEKLGGNVHAIEEQPIAFGLKSLSIVALIDEAAGGTDPLEEAISKVSNVRSVEVLDVRRALG